MASVIFPRSSCPRRHFTYQFPAHRLIKVLGRSSPPAAQRVGAPAGEMQTDRYQSGTSGRSYYVLFSRYLQHKIKGGTFSLISYPLLLIKETLPTRKTWPKKEAESLAEVAQQRLLQNSFRGAEIFFSPSTAM